MDAIKITFPLAYDLCPGPVVARIAALFLLLYVAGCATNPPQSEVGSQDIYDYLRATSEETASGDEDESSAAVLFSDDDQFSDEAAPSGLALSADEDQSAGELAVETAGELPAPRESAGAESEDSMLERVQEAAAESPSPGGGATLRPGVQVRVTVTVAGRVEVEVDNRRVTDAGEIDLPLVKMVQLGGLTLDEAAARLRKSYEYFFIEPDVAVAFVCDAREEAVSPWGYVTIMGRVKNPGRIAIPATGELTVSKAILESGGFAPSAKDRAVRVTRRGANGEPEKIVVDVRAFVAGEGASGEIELKPGDVVYVPETLF